MQLQDGGECPFCGKDELEVECDLLDRPAKDEDMDQPGDWFAQVHCQSDDCGASGPKVCGHYSSAQDAINQAVFKWRIGPMVLATERAVKNVMDESLDLPADVAPAKTFPPPL
jgi:hypothetical protein